MVPVAMHSMRPSLCASSPLAMSALQADLKRWWAWIDLNYRLALIERALWQLSYRPKGMVGNFTANSYSEEPES